MKINLQDWLLEEEIPTSSPGDMPAGQAPPTDPTQGTNAPDPQIPQQGMPPSQPEADDVTKDPQTPEMPEEKPDKDNKSNDFEVWKKEYLKTSIKGDPNELMDLLHQVKDKEGLQAYQRKFIEDNMNITLLSLNANIQKASREIRRNVREQLDRNNPATSVANHMVAVLENDFILNNIFIKMTGYAGLKGDLHRKFIGSLLGAVQVGSGGNNEDLIYNEKEYSILISTRMNARWGDVSIGNWNLHQDDIEKYLSDPEIKRLNEGSPEERDILRRRIVMESISDLFNTRAFVITVVENDGTIYTLGWDISTSLRSGYKDGKLVVKTRKSDTSESMIDDEGKIIPLLDLNIVYRKESNNHDESGKPEYEDIDFLERKDGILFLNADLKTIKEASTSLQGMALKVVPFHGNPSDINSLRACVYSASDMLMRTCG